MRAILVGPQLDAVRALLRDGLDAIGVDLVDAGDTPPDLVLALVDRVEAAQVIGEAISAGGGAPVVAVLPFPDEVHVAQARAAGAGECYSLARSMDELRAVVAAILAQPTPPTIAP